MDEQLTELPEEYLSLVNKYFWNIPGMYELAANFTLTSEGPDIRIEGEIVNAHHEVAIILKFSFAFVKIRSLGDDNGVTDWPTSSDDVSQNCEIVVNGIAYALKGTFLDMYGLIPNLKGLRTSILMWTNRDKLRDLVNS